jgi:hypothetical protein
MRKHARLCDASEPEAPEPLHELVPTDAGLLHHPSLMIQAKDAHRSARREGGPSLMANELRMAGHPSLMIQAKGAHRSAQREGGRSFARLLDRGTDSKPASESALKPGRQPPIAVSQILPN